MITNQIFSDELKDLEQYDDLREIANILYRKTITADNVDTAKKIYDVMLKPFAVERVLYNQFIKPKPEYVLTVEEIDLLNDLLRDEKFADSLYGDGFEFVDFPYVIHSIALTIINNSEKSLNLDVVKGKIISFFLQASPPSNSSVSLFAIYLLPCVVIFQGYQLFLENDTLEGFMFKVLAKGYESEYKSESKKYSELIELFKMQNAILSIYSVYHLTYFAYAFDKFKTTLGKYNNILHKHFANELLLNSYIMHRILISFSFDLISSEITGNGNEFLVTLSGGNKILCNFSMDNGFRDATYVVTGPNKDELQDVVNMGLDLYQLCINLLSNVHGPFVAWDQRTSYKIPSNRDKSNYEYLKKLFLEGLEKYPDMFSFISDSIVNAKISQFDILSVNDSTFKLLAVSNKDFHEGYK